MTNSFFNTIDISASWENPSASHLTFIDLFAGCGGMSCGLEMAGLKGLAAVEHKEIASITYARNLNHQVVTGDICLPETKQRLYDIVRELTGGVGIDIVAGGPPCQGFSMAGKRQADDDRNNLYREYIEVVGHLLPKYIVMENVSGMRTMSGGEFIRNITRDLEALGYHVDIRLLNSADYCVPQKRERIIIIGNRFGIANLFPAPLLTPDRYVTVGDAIADLAYAPENVGFSHIYTKHSTAKVEAFKALKPGGHYSPRYNGTLRRLYCDRPSYTVTYSNGNCDIHPECPRVLTLRELARLQSFPDSFLFYGSKQAQGVAIGNAVPPLLAKAIGLALREMDRQRVKGCQ